MLRPEVDRMRSLLVEAITTLCRSGLQYSSNLKVEGLIGITLDEADIILVNLNRTYEMGHSSSGQKTSKDNDPSSTASIEDGEKQRSSRRTDSPGENHHRDSPRKRTHSEEFSPGRPFSPPKRQRSVTSEHSGTPKTHRPDSRSSQDIQIESAVSLSAQSDASVDSRLGMSPQTESPCRPSDDSVPRSKRSTPDTPAESTESQRHATPTKIKSPAAVIKIEIDSDPDIEEVKVENTAQSCSVTLSSTMFSNSTVTSQSLPATETSFSGSFPPEFHQTIPSIASGSNTHGEILASQLPPELANLAQTDTAVPVGMYSNTMLAQPGPSGLTMPSTSSATFIPTDAVPGSSQQKKCLVSSGWGSPDARIVNQPTETQRMSVPGLATNVMPVQGTPTDGNMLILKQTVAAQQGHAADFSSHLVCKYCNKTFATSSGRLRHEKSHLGKYLHFCDLCNKGFHSRSNYEVHMNGHLNRKPFSCQKCGKAFRCKYFRKRHEGICGRKQKTDDISEFIEEEKE